MQEDGQKLNNDKKSISIIVYVILTYYFCKIWMFEFEPRIKRNFGRLYCPQTLSKIFLPCEKSTIYINYLKTYASIWRHNESLCLERINGQIIINVY